MGGAACERVCVKYIYKYIIMFKCVCVWECKSICVYICLQYNIPLALPPVCLKPSTEHAQKCLF